MRSSGAGSRLHSFICSLGAEIASPPFDRVAALSGAHGLSVERPGELAPALTEALDCGGPSVIHVKIDPDALSTLRKDRFPGSDGKPRSAV